MSETSKIEWTDASWNPTRGCTKIAPGCAHCYAETFAERFRGVAGHPYERGFDPRLAPDKLTEPLKWKKPRRIFVDSMSDLFHEEFPADYIGKVWDVMAEARRHTFQVLTKRPERAAAIIPQFAKRHTTRDGDGWPLSNVHIGTSIANQTDADKNIPHLLQIPAAVRFLSVEPLIGPVNLRGAFGNLEPRVSWVIVGGESGHGARPMDLEWVRDILRQCRAQKVAPFVKQLGANPQERCSNCGKNVGRGVLGGFVSACGPTHAQLITEMIRIHHPKGGDMDEWPVDLRVREFPEVSR